MKRQQRGWPWNLSPLIRDDGLHKKPYPAARFKWMGGRALKRAKFRKQHGPDLVLHKIGWIAWNYNPVRD